MENVRSWKTLSMKPASCRFQPTEAHGGFGVQRDVGEALEQVAADRPRTSGCLRAS
jgi:hypothetical protein